MAPHCGFCKEPVGADDPEHRDWVANETPAGVERFHVSCRERSVRE